MDVIERKIRKERRRKYKLLRKFRRARDIATRHTHEKYTCNQLREAIKEHDEFVWYQLYSKNRIALIIYEWSERERTMFQ